MKNLTKDQVMLLKATFNHPVKSSFITSAVDFKGKFNSNDFNDDTPIVFGGYVKSDDEEVEITIGWSNIVGMTDEFPTQFCGYSFTANNVRNWQSAAFATKNHLQDVLNGLSINQ